MAGVIASVLVLGAAILTRSMRAALAEAGPAPSEGTGGRLLRPYRAAIATTTLLDVAAVAAGLAAPWPVKAVIDRVTSGTVDAPFGLAGPGHVVLVAVLVGVALVAVASVLDYFSAVLGEAVSASVGLTLRAAVFSKLVRLPGRSSYRTGELTARLTGDVARVQDAVVDRWRVVLPNAVALAGMVVLMAFLSPTLALTTSALAPLMGVGFWLRRRRVAGAQRVARDRAGVLAARLTEVVRSMPAVRAFGREDDETRRLDLAGRQAAVAGVGAVAASARLAPFADLILAANLAVVLGLGALQVRSHHLGVGGLVVFLTYLGALQQPVKAFSHLSRTLGQGRASRERLDALLDAPELHAEPGGARVGLRPPVIALHHVQYRYGDDREALRDVSCWMPAGQTTAVVGPSGAGKSTLLSLLLRLDDPSDGVVTFDGVDAKRYDLRSLRSRVSLVPQDPWLVDGTLAENIAYGRPGASEAQILAAGRLALVDEFAERLPDGWRTRLGEGGAALSGGQARRVALARAVLRDSPVLLLDEPTSGLDEAATATIIEAIGAASAGRTTVIVTHRPELARIADHVVALDAGTTATAPLALAN